MDDKVIQIEIVLNFLNTLMSKAVYYKEINAVKDLNVLRNSIYYDNDFIYEATIKRLQDVELFLKKYE